MEEKSTSKIQIDIEDLIMALQNHGGESEFYLDLTTGEVKFYYDGMLDGEQVDEDFDIDDYLEDPHFVRISGVASHESYEVMEKFIETLAEGKAQRELLRAISGRKPFRSFKDALFYQGDVRDQWSAFENEAYVAMAQDWLDEHEIDADLVKKSYEPT